MNITCKVKNNYKNDLLGVAHIDNTARVQCLHKRDNDLMVTLLNKLKENGKHPVLINTSLNFDNKPIIENPEDAIISLINQNIDTLIIGDFICTI